MPERPIHASLPSPPPPAARVAKTWHERDEWSKKSGRHAPVHFMNGDIYTGEWHNNLRHGRGIHACKDHSYVYEGQWVSDKRCGYGTLSIPVGAGLPLPGPPGKTMSAKRNGSSSGSGAATAARLLAHHPETHHTVHSARGPVSMRKVYAGDWAGDQRCGVGTAYYADGGRYEGQWKDNVRCGWGTMYYPDGARYDGEWRADMRHGQGILLLANHDRYEGIFVNDLKEGPGKFFFKQRRQVYEGEWSTDMPKCGTIHDLEARAFHPPAGMVSATAGRSRIPVLELQDPDRVLYERRQEIMEERVERLLCPGGDGGEDEE
ncbi:hypothetical protein BC828DRAFT_377442 [Blastocladiella britannica]|nr:hypothetical protein BC828DRAFT_377442 [Blastocladiella britannica]